MTDFRGMNRIRKALAHAKQAFQNIRFKQLKGMTIITNSTQPNRGAFIQKHRKSLIITACGLAVLVVAGIGGQKYVQANTIEYYKVLLKGQSIGEISSEQRVEQLLAEKSSELEKADSPIRYVLDDNQVTFEPERAYKKKVDDEATLTRLAGMLETHPIGVKLIVDDEVVGVVRDKEIANQLLERVKSKYVPASSSKKSGAEVQSLSTARTAMTDVDAEPVRSVTSVSFEEKVAMLTSDINTDQLSDPEELFLKLTEGEPIPRTYTVQAGDCIGCIASKLSISEELIYKNNTWIVDDKLKIGAVLDLSEMEPPILNVNSIEQVTEVEEIDPPIEYKKSDSMKLGEQKTLTKGTPGSQQVTYRLVKHNGALIEEEIIAQKLLKAAIPTVILKGTKVIRGEGSGKFSWPVIGAKITSYQGTRWGRMHEGIDMIGKSNILAADEGVIEFAGYKSGGLGNAIIINHNNGFKTIYGHMKSVKVKKGQIVEKGDIIGIMGSTGRSTGTHLHFEIHLNGKLKNPTSYL
jgi:murein DD-endopeptidase MepM/ murein hydrolase activator NlpD